MNGMFSYDNKFMSVLLRVTDGVILGLLWLICSLPVVTAGAASTAFYYAYDKTVCRKMGYAWRSFFDGLRTNFKQATKSWLAFLGLLIVALADIWVLYSFMEAAPAAGAFLGILLVLLGFLVMWGCVMFPYIARFENGTKETMRNAAIIMLANFFWSVLLLALFAVAVLASLTVPSAGLFAPAVYMYFANRILEHVFRKYMTPEEQERQEVGES